MPTASTALVRALAWTLATGAAILAGLWLPSGLADEDEAFLPSTGNVDVIHGENNAHRAPTEDAVIVVTSSGNLTFADRRAIEDLHRALPDAEVTAVPPSTGALVWTDDGKAAAFDVAIPVTEDDLPAAVGALRTWVNDRLEGEELSAYVTGSAGIDADAAAGNVDALLLLASLAMAAGVLILACRSAVLWVLPIITAVVAVILTRAGAALLAHAGLAVTELAVSISIVVVVGASTDYALLLLSRLQRLPHEQGDHRGERVDDVAAAVHAVRHPVLVSAGTVAVATLSLLLASVPGLRGLGPVMALGVGSAALVTLTLLPLLLRCMPAGSSARRPAPPSSRSRRRWTAVANAIGARPASALLIAATSLVVLALPALGWHTSADAVDNLPADSDARSGLLALRDHVGPGADAPVTIRTTDPDGVIGALAHTSSDVRVIRAEDHIVEVILPEPSYSDAWLSSVADVRSAARTIDPSATVGGSAAVSAESSQAVAADTKVIAPALVVLIGVILLIWLRSAIAVAVILLSSLLNGAAAVGLSWLVLEPLTGQATAAPEVLLFSFIFLFAFGVDYIVFLLHAVREARSQGDPLDTSTRRALVSTGPVITSAGAVLAATFAMLLFVPEAAVRQIGVLVAVGVLIDTAVTRTVLIPAVLHLLPVGVLRTGTTTAQSTELVDR